MFPFASSAESSGGAPGPDGLPVLGNTLQFMRNTPEFYEEVVAEYGDVVSLSVRGMGETYLLANPELFETVFMDFERFGAPEFVLEGHRSLFGDGIVTSTGESWRRQRTLMQPAFARDRIDAYADVMTKHAERTVAEWEPGATYDLEEEMKGLTLRVLVEAMFGSDLDYDNAELRKHARYLEAPGSPENQPVALLVPEWVPIPMWRRYREGIAYFEEIAYDLIEERRNAAGDRDDLLSTLLAARDDDGDRMSDDLLRDEMMAILIAGHETTALTLTAAWYLLARNPDVRDRLHAELDDVLDGRTPTVEDLPDLDYTEGVVREALRLYPPAPTHPREPKEDVELGGHAIPEGSFVAMSAWVVHRDDRYYDDPEAFRPDRWTDEFEADLPSFAFCPFGGGPRQCLGQHFAMVEAQLLLATIAQAVDLELRTEEPLDVSAVLVLLPETDLEVAVRPR